MSRHGPCVTPDGHLSGRRAGMPSKDRRRMTRRDFTKSFGLGTAAALALGSRAHAQAPAPAASPYPDWIPSTNKPPKKGGSIARASAWDPPVLDPRHTQSVGLYQFAG